MGGIFGFDATSNKTSQTTVNQQATSQYGDVTGGTSDSSIGSKGAGIGAKSKITSAKGGSVGISIVNTTLDSDLAKAAIAGNTSLAIASLQSQQNLSTLAVGYANANATNALLTLQALGPGQQTVAAGGSPQDVIDANALTTTAVQSNRKPLIIGAAIIAGAILIYALIKHP